MHKDVLKRIIIIIAGFVVLALVFGAGIFVGGMKARFSYRWAENYHQNFAGPRNGFMGDWRNFPSAPENFIESHGTFGEIIKINGSDFVIKGQNDMEKVIVINENTVIEKGRTAIKKDELKVGDSIVVIGSSNDKGQIEAKLIRLFDGKDINKVK